MNLVLAPLFPRIVLVEAGEIAVIAFVQGLVPVAGHRLDLRYACTAARGDHQLGGFVVHDTRVTGDVKRCALLRPAVEGLGVAAPDS